MPRLSKPSPSTLRRQLAALDVARPSFVRPPHRRLSWQTALPFWLVALVLVCFAVIVAIDLYSIAKAPMPTGTAGPVVNTVWYADQKQGFRFRYQLGWQVKEQSPNELVVTNGVETIALKTAANASDQPLFPDATVSLTLHGTPATRYHDYDPVSGQVLDRVVIKRSDGRVTEIRGIGNAFESLILSFQFLKQKGAD